MIPPPWYQLNRKSYPVNAKHQPLTLSTGKASTSCPLNCNVCVITDVITGKQGVRIGDGAADDHSLKLFIKSERVQLIIFKLVYDS